jgi:hypothetical protein
MKIIITERQEDLLFSLLTEGKNKPTNPKLWAQCLAWARSRYDVCPSAYCNGAAAKRYKSKGGGWRKVKKSTNESVNEDLKRWFKEKWVDVSFFAGT